MKSQKTEELVVGQADKGKGITSLNEVDYISKEQDQLKICDVELAKKPEHILIRN